MKKAMWRSLLVAFVLCLSLLPTAALADETTAPCTDGQHTWYYGNQNCTECGAPLRAAVSWESSSVGGYYTEVKMPLRTHSSIWTPPLTRSTCWRTQRWTKA